MRELVADDSESFKIFVLDAVFVEARVLIEFGVIVCRLEAAAGKSPVGRDLPDETADVGVGVRFGHGKLAEIILVVLV